MTALPDSVRQAWEDRDGPAILATVSPDGVPNIIYVGCVGAFGDDRLVVADNYFHKRGACCSAARKERPTRSRARWNITRRARSSMT